MKYKGVAFDLDGTLIDTEKAITLSLIETVRVFKGIAISYERMAQEFGTPSARTFASFGINEHEIEAALNSMSTYFAKHDKLIRVFPKIIDVLSSISLVNIPMGIVTSKTRKQLQHEFEPHGLNRFFAHIVCADDTEHHKPHPAPLLKYLEMAELNAHEVLYIGDSVYDLECANSAGVDFALAAWGAINKNLPAKHVLIDPGDILKVTGLVDD